MTAAVFTATLLSAGQGAAADNDPKTIVVHLQDYESTSLGRAEKQAAGIFATAGIRIVWTAGHADAAATDRAAFHVTVVLLSREMAEKKIAAERIDDNVLGRAVGPSRRAYIFCHRVADVAARNSRDFDSLLGDVIAHEIGHLVLPFNAHSERGIMRASLSMRSSAAERFSEAQAVVIRTIVSADAAVR